MVDNWKTPQQVAESLLAENSPDEAVKYVRQKIYQYEQISERYLTVGAPSEYAQEWIDSAIPFSHKVLALLNEKLSLEEGPRI